ncbi:hypothetical protein B425_0243 [Bacillus amyloliquefaciens]|nr:hypothetical protein B425_0243 [Bacillus amyloliquefaciens]
MTFCWFFDLVHCSRMGMRNRFQDLIYMIDILFGQLLRM